MKNLDFQSKMEKVKERLETPEQMLASGLMQPFANTNSGSRKLMHSTHRTHTLVLMNPEKAIVETGFEIQFAEHSSSMVKSDSDYVVIEKISKFSFAPNHHYWLILMDTERKYLDIQERISYKHITESYGYLYNNNFLDNLGQGSVVKKDDIVKKSLAFDDFNNRQDGVNLNTMYMSLDGNLEDSIWVSDVAKEKLRSQLIKPVRIMINENDIPLNIYGDDNLYKIIPDIGENINEDNGILISLRKEKKEEALFMQSTDRLRKPLMSDDKYVLHGKVIDINIQCNNYDSLEGPYMEQLKMYNDELQRECREFVYVLTPYVAQGYKLSRKLKEKFALAKRIINKDKFIDKRLFSNIILDIYVLEELELNVGDKLSNRYGGKGVISRIVPEELMPQDPITGEHAEVIFNSYTMYNRENPGQMFELSLTRIGAEICRLMSLGALTVEDCFNMILEYTKIAAPSQHDKLKSWGQSLEEADLTFFVDSVISEGHVDISNLPMSESMDIDKLNTLYKSFPFIQDRCFSVPMKDSNGEIRYVNTRRSIVMGKEYIIRLKQYAEEKFSSTSLSATNIRNENIKSKAAREYRELYSNTPIRAGNMEIDNLNHIGSEFVVTALMLHSLSPHGRRLVESFYTDDPYTVDIKLDQNSSNRSAEIVNTYLKTIGLRLKFIKRKKHKTQAVHFNAIYFTGDAKKQAIFFNNEKGFDFAKDIKEKDEWIEKKKKRPFHFNAIKFFK